MQKPDQFKSFYMFAYDYSKVDGQKVVGVSFCFFFVRESSNSGNVVLESPVSR